MSLDTAKTPPKIEPLDTTLEHRIDETRRLLLQVDLWLALLSLATFLLGGLLLAIFADHWFFKDGLSGGMRFGVFFVLALGAGLYVYRRIVPLFLYPINPVYAANVLEQSTPTVKNSIINWLLLRQERLERGDTANKLVQRMLDGVTQTAASNVVAIPTRRAVDTRGVVRWLVVFVSLILLFFVYSALSPKNPLTSLARVLFPFSAIDTPQAVRFSDIKPGNTVAIQGERQTISVSIQGRNEEPVYLFFSTDDGQAVRQAIPMTAVETGVADNGQRFETVFPPGKQGFVSGVDYWIGQGDSRSGTFRIDVRPVAAIEIASVTYKYPEYTGLAEESFADGGDIRAVEGTEVTIRVRSTLPIQKAEIVFDNDPAQTQSMRLSGSTAGSTSGGTSGETEATATLTLKLDPESPSATTVRSFSFRATDLDGYESRRSGVFRLEVLPDKTPIVQWSDTDETLKDVAELDLPLNSTLDLAIQAEDLDFALRYLRFHVESGNKRIRPVELLESAATGPTKHSGAVEVKTVFSPITSRLTEGDSAEIWAEAVDTKLPEANAATTRRITVRIGPPKQQEPKDEEQQPENQEPKPEDQPKKPEKSDNKDRNQNEQEENQTGEEQDGKNHDSPQSTNQNDENGDRNESSQDDMNSNENSDENSQKDSTKDGKKQDGQEKSEQGKNPDDKQGDTQKKSGETDQNEQQKGDREDSQQPQQPQQPEQPIDPETNPGDAMEKIIDQMKKEGKLPEEPKKENSQKDSQEQQEPEKQENQKPQQDQQKSDCDQQGNCDQPGGGEQGGQDGNDSGQGDKEGQGDSGQNDAQKQGNQSEKSGDNNQSSDSNGAENQNGDSNGAENQNSDGNGADGGGKDSSQGKKSGGETAGGDQKGDPGADPSTKKGDNRNSDKQDLPVDPNDTASRERDDSLDPNTKDRRSQGGDSSDPKKSKQDLPHNSQTTGDEGRGQESTQSGQSDRAQSAEDGKKGDRGKEGVQQEGGDQGTGEEQTDPQQSEKDSEQNEHEHKECPNGKCQSGQCSCSGGGGQKSEGNGQKEGSGKDGAGENNSEGDQSGDTEGGQNGESGQSGQPGQSGKDAQPGNPSQTPGDGEGDSKTGVSGGSEGSSIASADTEKEKANLEYAEKMTNLVLEYLEDQLKDKPDQELLDRLGWNEQELREFHRTWSEMAEKRKTPDADKLENDAWKEALKSMGLRPSGERQNLRESRNAFKDGTSATESRRYTPPSGLKKRFRQYTEGIGAAGAEN